MGKKCLIMFITFKCGTGREVRNITNFTLRTIPLKYRVESDDSGVFNSASCSISNKKRALEEMRKHISGLHEHVRAITEKMSGGIDERKSRDVAYARYKKMATMEVAPRMKGSVTDSTTELNSFLDDELRMILSELKKNE